ncbi:MAG: hypothetical protein ACREU7_05745 [Burkholderiales bacterium]
MRGATTIDFLARFFLVFGLYGVALVVVHRYPATRGRGSPDAKSAYADLPPADEGRLRVVVGAVVRKPTLVSTADTTALWFFAIAFRVVLLFSPPTLSDDVYRYLWDGHIQNAGINPYAYRVDAPELDALATPARGLVNNAWMASPYLPVAQIYFAAGYRLAPESVTVFQVGAMVFDLASGLFLTLTLRRIGLPAAHAMIHLWNPLAITEVAHGAHVDALMTMLMMAALWLFGHPPAGSKTCGRVCASAILLGLATLVKPIPALLVPALMWRWGWKRALLYAAIVAAGIAAYANAGLGLEGELSGTGVFGATRIYLSRWNFNGGLFHWLEVALTGVQTPGAVPIESAGPGGQAARSIVLGALVVAMIGAAFKAKRVSDVPALFRIALLPLGAYVLFATTINPWYLLPIIAVLPFQVVTTSVVKPCATKVATTATAAWLYFSAAVTLSYLTYLDPLNLRETYEVRAIEYLPLYAGLLAAGVVSVMKRLTRRSAASTA